MLKPGQRCWPLKHARESGLFLLPFFSLYANMSVEVIMIKIDARQLKKFGEHTRLKRPSQAIAIIRAVLNDQAFSTRKQAQERTIPGMFHNRNSWIISSILVNKATGKDTRNMYSETGAAKKWGRNKGRDFMGMKEQELGENKRNPNIHTEFTRGGAFSDNVQSGYRRNKLGVIVSISGSHTRAVAMLRQLDSLSYKDFIYIKNSSRMKKGIYKFGNKTTTTKRGRTIRPLKMVVDKSKSTARIRKRPWLTKARTKAVTQQSTMAMFRKQWSKYTK